MTFLRIRLVFLASLVLGSSRAQSFQLDTSFGINGTIYQRIDSTDAAPIRLVTLPNGKFLSLNWIAAHTPLVQQFLSNGELDPSFGVEGIHIMDLPGVTLFPSGLLITADHKIIVTCTGTSAGAAPEAVLYRLTTDGQLDTSFGANGIARSATTGSFRSNHAALQSTGRILMIGGSSGSILVFAFTPDGQIDHSFANNGVGSYTLADISVGARCIAIGTDDAIYIGGYRSSNFDAISWVVAKLTPNGTLDQTFANAGFFVLDHISNQSGFNRSETVYALHIQPSGAVMVAGYVAPPDSWERFAAVRLHPNGVLDGDFGDNGYLYFGTDPNDRNLARDLIFDPIGQYLIIGYTMVQHSWPVLPTVARFDGTGQPIDPDGTGGIFTYTPPIFMQLAATATLDQQGRLIFGTGYFNKPEGTSALTAFTYSAIPTAIGAAHSSAREVAHVWPNPASHEINVSYTMDVSGQLQLDLFDAQGRRTATFARGYRPVGAHQDLFALPVGLAAGRYQLVIRKGDAFEHRPVDVVR